MSVTAIILAGGVGNRMHSAKPKQFLEIDGIPLLVYTLLNFQKNKNIDSICVTVLDGYQDMVWSYKERFSITKLDSVVAGGKTGHDSTRNAVFYLKKKLQKGDFVVVHDAARPILPQIIIDDMIRVAKEKGNACSSIPMNETIVVTDDQISGRSEIDRSRLRRVQTPQCYDYAQLEGLYEKAESENRHDFVYANTMAIHYGVELFFSKGFSNNVKITTQEDIALFKALSSMSEDQLVSK